MSANKVKIGFEDGDSIEVKCGEFWFSVSKNLQLMVRLEVADDVQHRKLTNGEVSFAEFDSSAFQQIEKLLANNSDATQRTLILEVQDQDIYIQPFTLESTATGIAFRKA